MKRFKFLFGLCTVVFTVFLAYSCAKEADNAVNLSREAQKVEIRNSASACSPQTLYTEYDTCIHDNKTDTISFALGPTLYSTTSKIYQLCPDLKVIVSYTFTTCNIGPNEVHFIHNLTYNLASMIAACPALQTEINNQYALGELESFLDLIDHEISMQTEFTEAYNAAKKLPAKYSCETGGQFYSVKYIKNTCYKWVPFTMPTPFPVNAYRKEDCGSSVCCARSAYYCVESFYEYQPNLTYGLPRNYQKFEGSCTINCTHDCGGPILDPNSL